VDAQSRTFTRAEAEAILPAVARLLDEAAALATRVVDAEQAAQTQQWRSRTNGTVKASSSGEVSATDRQVLARELGRLVERVQAMGVIVRDVRSGLIDFPSLREGRLINLCWRRGEPLEIRWWHEVSVGFAGRQPL
jgi:hypothetical protein